ncbi:MAG: hypothetical protein HC902_14345 [Calothrix sp. SM1_5_4]|nr:hypothetical protein [Calothrix sp. SM1_5_4]
MPVYAGVFRFDSVTGVVIFERSLASGTSWSDVNFVPNGFNSILRHKLKDLAHVSVEIKAQLNVSSPGLPTACAMLFAFGDGTAHVNAPNMGTNMRVANRDWTLSPNANKTPRDYFRIGFETFPDAEKLTIDAPINSYNQASAWGGFTAAQWREVAGEFNVMRTTSLTSAGDYIVYRQDMYFNLANNQVVVTITPLSSNLDMTDWQTQTVVWDPSQPVGATVASGSLRGGFDLTNITGPAAITLNDLGEEYVNIGFTGNQAPRACEFSNLRINKPQ